MKSNMAYRRFRHFGKDKITMDFAFFAMVFNIKKMCSKMLKGEISGLSDAFTALICVLIRLFLPNGGHHGRKTELIAA